MQPKLSGIPETLLISLWARAVETERPGGLCRDERAVHMLQAIDYDFGKFERTWMSQLGVAVRTQLLDRAVRDYLRENPRPIVINLGAGLDTRFWRLDDGKVLWYDVDLPEVVALKRQFVQETERYRLIAASLLEANWPDLVGGISESPLLIAEGVLMYLEPEQARGILLNLVNRFAPAKMLLEMVGPALVGRSRYNDTVGRIGGAEFKWSLKNCKDLESWDERIKVVEEWYYSDYCRERWRWFGRLTRIGYFKRLLSNRIVMLRFEP
jgi:O-methyltransferase involved in polyketide biosynthesis